MGTIQKRGDTYRALVRKKGTPALSKTFAKKSLAQRWIAETEAAISGDTWEGGRMTLAELIDMYIERVDPVKPMSASKRSTLGIISRAIGHHRLEDLTAEVWSQFAIGRKVSPATAQTDMVYAGVVLRTAKALWRVRPKMSEYENAMRQLRSLGVISQSMERDRRVSDDEIGQIVEHTKGRYEPLMADLVSFAVNTSMRQGEQCGLLWEDLSEDGRSIIIRQRKHPRQKRDQRVPLVREAQEIIQRQPRQGPKIFPYDARMVYKAFAMAAERAGVEDIRWHDLRHEGVSRLFERGLDMMAVAVFSGHRDVNMLRRYTHLSAEKILESL